MGCFWSRRGARRNILNNTASPLKDEESNTNDRDDDISNYMYQGLNEEWVGKGPGQLRGEDFIIEDCKNSTIYLLDHNAAVTIDDCSDCNIFIGPCKGSVFIRDCVRCVLMVSCQQFRTRDCKQCVVYLHCTSQPVIEASSEMRFGCFQCHYPELGDQFQSAGLSVFTNNWFSVHNFTPEVEDSWSLIRKDDKDPVMTFSPPMESDLSNVQLTFDPSSSDLPLSHGGDNVPPDLETCLIVFFNFDNLVSSVLTFTRQITQQKAYLVMSKEVVITGNRLTDFFPSNATLPFPLPQGQSIFLEVCGEECVSVCTALLSYLPSQTVYWSRDKLQANKDIQHFHQLIEQQFRL